MADSEKAPEQQQPANTEANKNDNASNPPAAEEQKPKQIIGMYFRLIQHTLTIQLEKNFRFFFCVVQRHAKAQNGHPKNYFQWQCEPFFIHFFKKNF